MRELAFGVALLSLILLGGSLVLSIVRPALRVWPPPQRASWQYFYVWGLIALATLAFIVFGILDWDSFVFTHWLRFITGGLLLLSGASLALWAVTTLGPHTSLGLGGDLVATGPYRYSRNPQYVGDIAMLVGYAMVCNSGLALVAAGLASSLFFLTPFAEEPWLRERLGVRYEEYAAKVPRFFSLHPPHHGSTA